MKAESAHKVFQFMKSYELRATKREKEGRRCDKKLREII